MLKAKGFFARLRRAENDNGGGQPVLLETLRAVAQRGAQTMILQESYAHKKGEVVVPAGGETGVPRCLAEVRKLLKAALFRYFKKQFGEFNVF